MEKLKSFIMSKETAIIQFIKFGMVGALNTVLSYVITNGSYYVLHLGAQASNIIAFIIFTIYFNTKNLLH